MTLFRATADRHGHGRTPFGMQSARGLLRTIPDDLPRTTFVSAVAVAAVFVGMAVGSYLDLAPPLTAQGIERPTSNNAPIGGNLTATTFRDTAAAQTAMVVTIWTEQPRPQVARKEFFRRGEESFGGEDFRRFFGQPPGFDRNRSGERNED